MIAQPNKTYFKPEIFEGLIQLQRLYNLYRSVDLKIEDRHGSDMKV